APGLPDSSFIISGQVLFVKHFFDIFLNFFFREILFRLCRKSANPMVFLRCSAGNELFSDPLSCATAYL
ncbi:hypothetical protein MR772_04530, partial [bacterium]|nr:hypothetical protein [bacterium]